MNFLNEFPDQAPLPALLLFLAVIQPQRLVPPRFLVFLIYFIPCYLTGSLADEWDKRGEWVSWEGMGYFRQLSHRKGGSRMEQGSQPPPKHK